MPTRPARPRIWLSETAKGVVVGASKAAHPIEAGGVLLGVYTRGRPWIAEAVAVRSVNATGNFYELPAGARHHAVDSARARDERLGYMGDWHSHPADVGPSGVDLSTMRDFAADGEAQCPHPVLLIARRAGDTYWMDARQLARKRMRRLRIIMAGDLSVERRNATPRTK